MSYNIKSSKWVRVSRHNPCQICGKTDWCRVLNDGTPICSRVESSVRYDNGGWIHTLDKFSGINIPASSTVKESIKTSIEILNQTYGALLSELILSVRHKENLQKRGFSDNQIAALNYQTMPIYGRDSLVRKLLSENYQLEGVPGFFTDMQNSWHLAGAAGICIPVRDLQGNIQGITIRCDTNFNGKYKWLSSAKKLNGCSSGAPIHVAKPVKFEPGEVWITEGPIKADMASLKLNRIVIAVPGVNNFKGIIPILKELKPQLVITAYDMDKLSNPTVKRYEGFLLATLLRMKIRTFQADWDHEFKGIDDFIIGD
jgi:hypothetical protein